MEEQERRRKIEDQTLGAAYRNLQRRFDELRRDIATAIGDAIVLVGIWFHRRAGRGHLSLVISGAHDADTLIRRLLETLDMERESLRRKALGEDTKSYALEDRCGAAPGTATHEIGSLPRDCQKCHDHNVERNR